MLLPLQENTTHGHIPQQGASVRPGTHPSPCPAPPTCCSFSLWAFRAWANCASCSCLASEGGQGTQVGTRHRGTGYLSPRSLHKGTGKTRLGNQGMGTPQNACVFWVSLIQLVPTQVPQGSLVQTKCDLNKGRAAVSPTWGWRHLSMLPVHSAGAAALPGQRTWCGAGGYGVRSSLGCPFSREPEKV